MQPSIIQEYGYTWVALPKESLMPLTLLEEVGTNFFKRIFNLSSIATRTNSSIFDLFPKSKAGKSVFIKNPEKAPFFNGFDISKKGAGLSVKGVKGLQSISNVDTGGSLDQASMLLYSFKSPEIVGIHTEVLLEEHLNGTPVNENAVGFVDKLHNGKLFVVTEILQCREFSVEDGSSFKIDGYANIETLNSGLGQFKGNGNLDNKLSKILTYTGTTPLTFALKARRIRIYEYNGKTKYSLYDAPLKKVKGGFEPEAEVLRDSPIVVE